MKRPRSFALVVATLCLAAAWPVLAGAYKNFNVAIYVAVNTARQLGDAQTRERQYQRIASQVKFDKVYLEVYRDRNFLDEKALRDIKKFFAARGVAVSGGVTLAAGGSGGQFGTFDYEDPKDREEYRLATMRDASRDLVLAPARAVNPRVKVIIKYPNWYEHFQGLGYDLEEQPKLFDFIYTGTETRDPEITDQLLQQYLSYGIYRYFDNIRPNGGNRGGWVDTFSTRYIDRYAEQLWDTLFAKAPEITLFSWAPLASDKAVEPGERTAWRDRPTSFNWDEMVRSFNATSTARAAGPRVAGRRPAPASAPRVDDARPGWARAAGYSLEQADAFLGKPIGLAAYKPYHSRGEDFLHSYLGNIGIPIELVPQFPTTANIVLLTESAKHDPDIVRKMKSQLAGGRNVVMTSGLLRVLQGKGIEDIVELEYTNRSVAIRDFLNGYGAGNGTSLNDPAQDAPAIWFPEIRFYTNDSWALIRGVASARGFPILLMNRYARGVLYVLAIPDNIGDLYRLPQPVMAVIRNYLLADFPVRIDAADLVSLFAYDNGTFIVQSFLPAPTSVNVSVSGVHANLRNLVSSQLIAGKEAAGRTTFGVPLEPHSYLAFAVE